MGDEALNLKVLVDGYSRNIQAVERELSELSQRADELTREVEADKAQRESVRECREALERERNAKLSERQSLMGEHAEATFTQDTGELQRIARRRVALDKELAQVQENIRNLREVPKTNFGEQAATLQDAKERLEKRLPKQFYNTNANLHLMLEGISEVLRADAERLRRRWLSINIPNVYSKQTLESARARNNNTRKSEPAFLQRRENERRERMQRFGHADSTDAYHAAMTRTYREPEPRTSVTSGQESGVLSGDEIRKALAAKQSA